MASEKHPHVTEQESLQVAEAARQTEWEQPSFMSELFLGNFRLDLIHPFPLPGTERPEFTAFYSRLHDFLQDEVDPAEIDRTGEYPQHVLDGLRRLGAFGMKIPKEYGGLGFTNVEYNRVMKLARQLLRQPRRAALGAPVDRRARSRSRSSAPRSRRRSTCPAAPGARSRPSP